MENISDWAKGQQRFTEYLEHATAVVRSWPKWKQTLLGGTEMSDDLVKIVIVVRRKFPDGKGGTFGARAGKTGIQMTHALEGLLRKDRAQGTRLCGSQTPLEQEYRLTGHTKICVQVESEEQLLDVFQKAVEAKLPVYLVTDAGRTEFKGQPTVTCLAIGPARSSEVDKITGQLKLY